MSTESATTTSSDELAPILDVVKDDLAAVDAVVDEVLRPPTPSVRVLVEHVKRYRGKMLRPALALLAGRSFGEIGRPHHQLAAVVEMIHVATLVHDDVLDGADRRRGVSTANDEFGIEAAVLLGDYLFATAFALSANLENRLASRYLAFVTGVVCQGEIAQIRECGNLDLPEEVYLDVIEKKTAWLFAASARVGAEYQEAPEAACRALSDYGMRLGTAFQIVDDCLDLVGDESIAGKTLGTDAGQGKVTLPVIHHLRSVSAKEADRMRDLLRDGGDRREEIRRLLEASGSLEYARRRAEELVDAATAALRPIPAGPPRAALERLARYSLLRRR